MAALVTITVMLSMNRKAAGWPTSFAYFGPPAAFSALQLMETTAVAVILISLDPLFMLIFSRVILGKTEVITPMSLVYMSIALAGCAIAVLN